MYHVPKNCADDTSLWRSWAGMAIGCTVETGLCWVSNKSHILPLRLPTPLFLDGVAVFAMVSIMDGFVSRKRRTR